MSMLGAPGESWGSTACLGVELLRRAAWAAGGDSSLGGVVLVGEGTGPSGCRWGGGDGGADGRTGGAHGLHLVSRGGVFAI